MNTSQTSPLEAYRDKILDWVAHGQTYAEIIRALNAEGLATSDRSIRRALRRWDVQRPDTERAGIRIEGDTATVISSPSEVLATPEDLLRSRGLDPDEWEVINGGLTINEWDAMTSDKATGDNRIVTMRQLKIVCARKKPYAYIMPAVEGPSFRLQRLHVQLDRKARLVVFVGCQQAPYQDPILHDKFCQWLEFNVPDEAILMGDTLDLPDISRHPANPEWHVTAQESINSGYLMLRDYVQASTSTQWKKILGNHDERIRKMMLTYVSKLWGVRPADIPGEDPFRSVWDIRDLLHLDPLGIDLIEPQGNYTHAMYKVSDKFAAIHGERVKKDAGASVLAHLDEVRHDLVMAHTHRQGLTHKTAYTIEGDPFTITGMEIGTMALIKGGLGYASRPNWQNGFGTAIVWPDGTVIPELARYRDGKLSWRDQRY